MNDALDCSIGKGVKAMTMMIDLPKELEKKLATEANRNGISVNAYVIELLNRSLLNENRESKIINLIQSWIDDSDPEEQKETGIELIRALDEDRQGERQLFPVNLKGITW